MSLSILPDDLIRLIYEYLSPEAYIIFALGCRRFHQLNTIKIKLMIMAKLAESKGVSIEEILIRTNDITYFELAQCILTNDIFNQAAEEGKLKLLEQLRDRGIKGTYDAIEFAVKANHLDVVKWLEPNYGFNSLINDALNLGHVDIFNFLLDQGYTYTYNRFPQSLNVIRQLYLTKYRNLSTDQLLKLTRDQASIVFVALIEDPKRLSEINIPGFIDVSSKVKTAPKVMHANHCCKNDNEPKSITAHHLFDLAIIHENITLLDLFEPCFASLSVERRTDHINIAIVDNKFNSLTWFVNKGYSIDLNLFINRGLFDLLQRVAKIYSFTITHRDYFNFFHMDEEDLQTTELFTWMLNQPQDLSDIKTDYYEYDSSDSEAETTKSTKSTDIYSTHPVINLALTHQSIVALDCLREHIPDWRSSLNDNCISMLLNDELHQSVCWLLKHKFIQINQPINLITEKLKFNFDITYLLDLGCTFTSNIITIAVTVKSIKLLDRLFDLGYSVSPVAFNNAMVTEDMQVIEWVYSHITDVSSLKVRVNANQPIWIKWLIERKIKFKLIFVDQFGIHIPQTPDILEYMDELVYQFDVNIDKQFLSGASLPVIKYLVKRGLSIEPFLNIACKQGDLSLIDWLIDELKVKPKPLNRIKEHHRYGLIKYLATKGINIE
jgi:hypothetical protein